MQKNENYFEMVFKMFFWIAAFPIYFIWIMIQSALLIKEGKWDSNAHLRWK